ncbi:putative oxidoreductase GLYR1 homolog [Trichonephila inaurata madagascariensis]|uniref:Cytokine-like nuclear factor N-PAC n=1 Tax=Trichonephila inaurata madagascariensis TaxID=2747483 RepID=A0A8X7C5X8_9ARAC|nr:putative oxidoreductase GLYR1 homolog [Trichonephila inaurata madagascariensis]
MLKSLVQRNLGRKACYLIYQKKAWNVRERRMVDKNFEIGDLVWAKMKRYPPWPAQIADPPLNGKIKKGHHYVYFFGSKNFAWISEKDINHHSESCIPPANKKKSALLQSAIDEIIALSEDTPLEENLNLSIDSDSSNNQQELSNYVVDQRLEDQEKNHSSHESETNVLEASLEEDLSRDGKSSNIENETNNRVDSPIVESMRQRHSSDKSEASVCDSSLEEEIHLSSDGESSNIQNEMYNCVVHPFVESMRQCHSSDESEASAHDLSLKEEIHSSSDGESSNIQKELNNHVDSSIVESVMQYHSSDESEAGVSGVCLEEDIHLNRDGESSNIQEELNNCGEHTVVKSNRKRHLTDESEKSNLVDNQNSKIAKIDDGNDITSKNAENIPGSSAECSTKLNECRSVQKSTNHFDEHNLANELRQYVKPTMKIGFIGVGAMGERIVKTLLLSGHQVTVYNRSPEKCNDSLKAGALRGETPADVVKASDIIFSCVSDASAAKSLLFGTNGVLKGLKDSNAGDIYKGYVELTSIDPESSLEIAECITREGGKYIEASMVGTRQDAEKGTLTILVSGDKTLFKNCTSCFNAMSRRVFFTEGEIGSSSKLRVIHSMFWGITYAATAEALSFAQCLNVIPSDLLNFVKARGVDFLLKGNAMLDRNNSTITNNTAITKTIKYQQKDMSLGINVSHTVSQPVRLAAGANAIYKQAKKQGADEQDVSSVILGTKY